MSEYLPSLSSGEEVTVELNSFSQNPCDVTVETSTSGSMEDQDICIQKRQSFLGPFRILKAKQETSNYKLELPPEYSSIHPNFHANLFKPFIQNDVNQFPLREPLRLPPIIPEYNQYEVEEVLDYKVVRQGRERKMKYLVHWTGYGQEEDSWIAEEDIHEDLVVEYRRRIEQENRE